MVHLNRFKSGFLLGFGVGFVSRDVLSNGPSIFRPVVKSTIKTGMAIAYKSREALVNLLESAEDLFAEIRSERMAKTGGPAHDSTSRTHVHAAKARSHAQKSKGT